MILAIRYRLVTSILGVALIAAMGVLAVGQQLDEGAFSGSPEHPAINYYEGPSTDAVAVLNRSLASDPTLLSFENGSGYLQSVLQALRIPIDSQLLVFSKTGIQGGRTSPSNPRALFFNDSTVLGYIRGAPFLELIAHDARQGAVFYTLDQHTQTSPRFTRRNTCLTCHLSRNTLDVPGMLVRSQFTSPTGVSLRQLGQSLVDHRTPFDRRWGGYFVTGTHGAMRHMGNAVVDNEGQPASTAPTLNVTSLDGRVDLGGYPSRHSDMVSLMVFDHQMRMMNLFTRVGWEGRVAIHEHQPDPSHGQLADAISELVDYMLFVDEAPLPEPVHGESGFTSRFSGQGPRDKKNRSLRELDLTRRLLRYPCSYMIYSEAFDALPPEVMAEVYHRLWRILSGQERATRYTRLSVTDRRAIVEILRDTKADLPAYFERVSR